MDAPELGERPFPAAQRFLFPKVLVRKAGPVTGRSNFWGAQLVTVVQAPIHPLDKNINVTKTNLSRADHACRPPLRSGRQDYSRPALTRRRVATQRRSEGTVLHAAPPTRRTGARASGGSWGRNSASCRRRRTSSSLRAMSRPTCAPRLPRCASRRSKFTSPCKTGRGKAKKTATQRPPFLFR